MTNVKTAIEPLEEVTDEDLEDLCDAAESAILDGGGFGWLKPPPRAVLGRYFRGVVLVPERHLFVGRLEDRVSAAIQLQEPPRNNEAQSHAATLTTLFVSPWARGHGIGPRLIQAVEGRRRIWDTCGLTLTYGQLRSMQSDYSSTWASNIGAQTQPMQ